jgi:hypothetical protein
MASYLAESTYGKDKVRVFRVVREDKVHHIVEYNVQVLLEGELDTRQAEIPLLFRVDFEGGERIVTRKRTTASSSRQIP